MPIANPYPEPITNPYPVETRILRLPAAGPEPANTLVHLHCLIAGVDEYTLYGTDSHFRVKFSTKFAIAGYDQRFYEWYLDTTEVSATAMLRHMSATTDFIFTIRIDDIEPFIDFATGVLGFVVSLRSLVDDEAWFPESNNVFITEGMVSAWILCWEPGAARPRGGARRTKWATLSDPSIWPKPRRIIDSRATLPRGGGSDALRRPDCDE